MNEKWSWKSFFIGLLAGIALTLLFLGVNRAGAQDDGQTMVPPPTEWLSGTQGDWLLEPGQHPDFSETEFPEATMVEYETWDTTATTPIGQVLYKFQQDKDQRGGVLRLLDGIEVQPHANWGEFGATELVITRAQVLVPVEFWPTDHLNGVYRYELSLNGRMFVAETPEEVFDLVKNFGAGTIWAFEITPNFCTFVPVIEKSD